MRQRHAERQRILRHHQVGRRGDVVDRRHLLVAGDVDRGDVGRVVAVLAPQILDRLHRGVRGDVDGKALEHDAERRPFLAEPARQRRDIVLAAIDVEEPERPFQHALRAGEAFFGEARRQHAAFGGAAEMQALDHRAGARARELQQARRTASRRCRARWSSSRRRTSTAARPRPRRRTARWCRAHGSRGPRCCAWSRARCGSSPRLPATTAAISSRPPMPRSCATASAGMHMVAARMHAGVRPGQVVHLEGMRQRAVGEGRHRRLQARAAGREDAGSCRPRRAAWRNRR